VLDYVGRNCLGLQALDGTDGDGMHPVFERLFREGGLPLWTEPASPEQNGAHERFHRTLKAETGQPVAGNRIAQQRRFNRFRSIYNHEGPHEALGQVLPASR
jgi:transposase InsO family protein